MTTIDFSSLRENLSAFARQNEQRSDLSGPPGQVPALPSAVMSSVTLFSDRSLLSAGRGVEDDYLEAFLYCTRYAYLLTLRDQISMHSPAARRLWAQAFADCGWRVSPPVQVKRPDIEAPIIEHVLIRLADRIGGAEMTRHLSDVFTTASLSNDEKYRWLLSVARNPSGTEFSFQATPIIQQAGHTARASLLFTHFTEKMVRDSINPGHWSAINDVFGTGYGLEIDLNTLALLLPVLRKRSHLLGDHLLGQIRL